MNMDEFVVFFRKRIEPFMVVGVLIIMVFLTINLIKGNQLRNEISQNCGWGAEDYSCFCQKSEVIGFMNKINNTLDIGDLVVEDLDYVQVDG